MDVRDLASRVRAGDRRALARALTLVENHAPEARRLLGALYPLTGGATVVGLTGPPGVGKSSLASALSEAARARNRRVGILAFDPTSPFTGGALLGDRARMESASRDPEIFVRSMGSRGHVGGLGAAAFSAIALLDAAGKDLIFVETVGVGQDEVEVGAAASVTIVVLAPGLGDEIQASKAGLLEIADVVAVNKADRDGAERLAHDMLLAFEPVRGVPILRTVATRGEGIEELLETVEQLVAHRAAGTPAGDERRRRFIDGWLRCMVVERVKERFRGRLWDACVQSVLERREDPFQAAEQWLATWIRDDPKGES